MIGQSLYHKTLRVSAALLALMLVFESGMFLPGTASLSLSTRMYVANVVGISASVQPTELNTITAALTERERDLSAREAALEREINARVADTSPVFDVTDYLLSAVLLLLVILILVNYVLDFVRARKMIRNNTTYAEVA